MSRDWTVARAKVDAEGVCRVCGYEPDEVYPLHAAHIVPRSLGGAQGEDSIVPLCSACHADYDDDKLDLLPHLTYEEQAEAVRVLGIDRARRRLIAHNPVYKLP